MAKGNLNEYVVRITLLNKRISTDVTAGEGGEEKEREEGRDRVAQESWNTGPGRGGVRAVTRPGVCTVLLRAARARTGKRTHHMRPPRRVARVVASWVLDREAEIGGPSPSSILKGRRAGKCSGRRGGAKVANKRSVEFLQSSESVRMVAIWCGGAVRGVCEGSGGCGERGEA